MELLEFARFGIAIQVDGKTVTSVHHKDYEIGKEGMEFAIRARNNPKMTTFTAVTNVAEWRKLSGESAATKSVAKSKSKPSETDS